MCPAVHIFVLMCVFKRVLLCVCVCLSGRLCVSICGFASGCCFSSSANDDFPPSAHSALLELFFSSQHVPSKINKFSPHPFDLCLFPTSYGFQAYQSLMPFPLSCPFLTISKFKALYQQLVSWPLAHVQKVKHPSLSASVLTLLCGENASAE